MKAKVKEEEEEEERGGDRRQRRQQQQQQQRRQQQQQRQRRRGRRPEWVERLLMGRYFGECRKHERLRKREVNFFCIDCRRKICFHCLPPHKQKHHKHLQIRKYVYRDVIRVGDLQNLLDLSRIQAYIVNAAKVVHLKPRDKSNPSGGPTCQICRQTVSSHANLFCSVACKLEAEAEVSDDNVDERLEPSSTHDPMPDLDNYGTDKEEEQQQQQQQQQQHQQQQQQQHQQQQQQQQQQQSYESGEENQGSRKQRRKGVPRRAPKF